MKPGYKTTEFWLTLLGSIATYVEPALPPIAKAIVTGALGVGYAISRGLAKSSVNPS